jgi:hypothetical protein
MKKQKSYGLTPLGVLIEKYPVECNSIMDTLELFMIRNKYNAIILTKKGFSFEKAKYEKD